MRFWGARLAFWRPDGFCGSALLCRYGPGPGGFPEGPPAQRQQSQDLPPRGPSGNGPAGGAPPGAALPAWECACRASVQPQMMSERCRAKSAPQLVLHDAICAACNRRQCQPQLTNHRQHIVFV